MATGKYRDGQLLSPQPRRLPRKRIALPITTQFRSGRATPLETNRMNETTCKEEAEDCRRKALSYLGRPEAAFRLRVAREFDRLASGVGKGFQQ